MATGQCIAMTCLTFDVNMDTHMVLLPRSCVVFTLIFYFSATRFQYEMVNLIPQGVCHLSHELQVITCPWGKVYHMDEITNFITKDVIDEYVMYQESFEGLHLSFEEASALKAFIMTCPGITPLSNVY